MRHGPLRSRRCDRAHAHWLVGCVNGRLAALGNCKRLLLCLPLLKSLEEARFLCLMWCGGAAAVLQGGVDIEYQRGARRGGSDATASKTLHSSMAARQIKHSKRFSNVNTSQSSSAWPTQPCPVAPRAGASLTAAKDCGAPERGQAAESQTGKQRHCHTRRHRKRLFQHALAKWCMSVQCAIESAR
jgi:hypothetical protein